MTSCHFLGNTNHSPLMSSPDTWASCAQSGQSSLRKSKKDLTVSPQMSLSTPPTSHLVFKPSFLRPAKGEDRPAEGKDRPAEGPLTGQPQKCLFGSLSHSSFRPAEAVDRPTEGTSHRPALPPSSAKASCLPAGSGLTSPAIWYDWPDTSH